MSQHAPGPHRPVKQLLPVLASFRVFPDNQVVDESTLAIVLVLAVQSAVSLETLGAYNGFKQCAKSVTSGSLAALKIFV